MEFKNLQNQHNLLLICNVWMLKALKKKISKRLPKVQTLPIKVMFIPNITDFKKLKELVIKMISMDNFLFNNIQHHLVYMLSSAVKTQSFKSVF